MAVFATLNHESKKTQLLFKVGSFLLSLQGFPAPEGARTSGNHDHREPHRGFDLETKKHIREKL